MWLAVSGVTVGTVMKAEVITIKPSAKVAVAADLMAQNNVGSVVVVDDFGKPLGIITERDIVRLVAKGSQDLNAIRAGECMSRPLLTVEPSKGLEEAVEFMVRNKIKKLPVVDNARLVGIVTLTDFARLEPEVVKTLESVIEEAGLPKTFEKYYKPRPRYVV